MTPENMYCDYCEVHTVQYWEKEGMKCSTCSRINPFCNISVEEFELYMVDMIRGNKWRSISDINHYFNKQKTILHNKFRSHISEEIQDILTNVAQFMLGIKPDGEQENWWSEWDEQVLQSVINAKKMI